MTDFIPDYPIPYQPPNSPLTGPRLGTYGGTPGTEGAEHDQDLFSPQYLSPRPQSAWGMWGGNPWNFLNTWRANISNSFFNNPFARFLGGYMPWLQRFQPAPRDPNIGSAETGRLLLDFVPDLPTRRVSPRITTPRVVTPPVIDTPMDTPAPAPPAPAREIDVSRTFQGVRLNLLDLATHINNVLLHHSRGNITLSDAEVRLLSAVSSNAANLGSTNATIFAFNRPELVGLLQSTIGGIEAVNNILNRPSVADCARRIIVVTSSGENTYDSTTPAPSHTAILTALRTITVPE